MFFCKFKICNVFALFVYCKKEVLSTLNILLHGFDWLIGLVNYLFNYFNAVNCNVSESVCENLDGLELQSSKTSTTVMTNLRSMDHPQSYVFPLFQFIFSGQKITYNKKKCETIQVLISFLSSQDPTKPLQTFM